MYDLAIVLANWMDQDGALNVETRDRVDLGVSLVKTGAAQRLLLIGWDYRADSTLAIADAMNAYQKAEHGLDPSLILIEKTSRDTVGDAVQSLRLFQPYMPEKSVIVVTSDYHATRTETIFSFVYGPDYSISVKGVKTANRDKMGAGEQASLAAFRDTFAGIKAGDLASISSRLTTRHPYYNGDVYPRLSLG